MRMLPHEVVNGSSYGLNCRGIPYDSVVRRCEISRFRGANEALPLGGAARFEGEQTVERRLK